ncbi:hypothetical protein JCM14635_15990 [Megalodesulfovibrio paquesii]
MSMHKKELGIGISLLVSFFVVLFLMFTPLFDGKNTLEASDNLFNSLSKGSTNFFDRVSKEADKFDGKQVEVTIDLKDKVMAPAITILTATGMTATQNGGQLTIKGDYGKMMHAANVDAELLYNQKDADVAAKYSGVSAKMALYTWWNIAKELDIPLKKLKLVEEAKAMNTLLTRSIEVGYNFAGIEPVKVKDRLGILIFSLAFYVAYTMWFGYGVLFTFNGLGFAMKAGKKKEA